MKKRTFHKYFVKIKRHWRRAMFRGDQRGESQVNWKNRKMRISLPLLLQLFLKYAYVVDVFIHQFTHGIFWWHFANSPKLLKNDFVNELDLTSFKFSAMNLFHSMWINWWIKMSTVQAYFKNSCKSNGREILIFLFFLKLDSSSLVYMQSATLIHPEVRINNNCRVSKVQKIKLIGFCLFIEITRDHKSISTSSIKQNFCMINSFFHHIPSSSWYIGLCRKPKDRHILYQQKKQQQKRKSSCWKPQEAYCPRHNLSKKTCAGGTPSSPAQGVPHPIPPEKGCGTSQWDTLQKVHGTSGSMIGWRWATHPQEKTWD